MGSVGDRRFLLTFIDAHAALNTSFVFWRPMILADSDGRDVNKPCKHSKIWAQVSKAVSTQQTSYLPALLDVFFQASEQIA